MMDEETLTEQKAVSMIRQAECVDKESSELRSAARPENDKLTPRHPCRRCGNRSHPVQQ